LWTVLIVVILLLSSLLGYLYLFILPQMLVDHTIALRKAQELKIADRLKAESDIRTTLLQALGALVVLAGAVTTWRQFRLSQEQLQVTLARDRDELRLGQEQLQVTLARDRDELRLGQEQLQATLARNREEFHLSQEGQVTERFTRAIDQLGNATLDVRLGGIYALERIAKDSPRDHGPIVEVLTAFVRERAPWPPAEKVPSLTPPGAQPVLIAPASPPKPSADIQAILTVLGRRVIDEKWPEPPRLDLSKTDLRGADLRKTHLEGADLHQAHLERAGLGRAHLEKAYLREAHLKEADLTGAHLEGADLRRARLEGADLSEARLEGAILSRAHLELADLREARLEGAFIGGAHLEAAKNLTKEQIDSAYTDEAQWKQAQAKTVSPLSDGDP
jgi:hypothetical protein